MNRTTSGISSRRLLGSATIAGLAAVSVNAAIYAVGRAADVEFIAKQAASGPDHIRLVHVVQLTVMAFAVGVVAALVVNRVRRTGLPSLVVLGGVIAVASTVMDVSIDSAVSAKLLLASMHLVTGLAYVVALRSAGVRRTSRPVDAVAAPSAQPVTV